MFHDRFKPIHWLAAAVVLAVAAPVSAAQGEQADDQKKPPAAQAKKDAPQKKAPPVKEVKGVKEVKEVKEVKGVVLRPKVVDGSVSAYTGAVRQADPEVKVYTNADLETMWSGDTRPWATVSSQDDVESSGAGGATPPPPLEWMEKQAAGAQERAKSIADAERELAAATAEVANLEKQLRAVTNPFSARPQLTDDEKAARATGENVAERKRRNEEQLVEARKRVDAARARLEQARRQP